MALINKNQLELELTSFLKSNYPSALETYEVLLKPTDSPDMRSNIQVQNLVKATFYCFLQAHPQSTTNLYILVRMFAGSFKEDAYIDELDKLWKGINKKGKIEIPIPSAEAIVIRDLSSLNFKVNQKYNHGFGKVFRLADITRMLLDAKRRIMGIFNEIYLKNDLDIPIQLPSFIPQNESDVMKPL